jgi:hypothetical protein
MTATLNPITVRQGQIQHLLSLAAALVSGQYQQTQSVLRKDMYTASGPAGYCCLGVACELFRQQTGSGEWALHNGSSFDFVLNGRRNYSDLGGGKEYVERENAQSLDEVLAYYGFTPYEHDRMWGMNDNDHRTFAEIAEYIKQTIVVRLDREITALQIKHTTILVKALRVGAYKQTTATLRHVVEGAESFCCLGVACDLYAKTLKDARWSTPDYDIFTLPNGQGVAGTFGMADELYAWYGFTFSEHNELYARNDRGESFAEIADYIESEILTRLTRKVAA